MCFGFDARMFMICHKKSSCAFIALTQYDWTTRKLFRKYVDGCASRAQRRISTGTGHRMAQPLVMYSGLTILRGADWKCRVIILRRRRINLPNTSTSTSTSSSYLGYCTINAHALMNHDGHAGLSAGVTPGETIGCWLIFKLFLALRNYIELSPSLTRNGRKAPCAST